MITRFNDYDKVKSYGDFKKLPKGGYVCRIEDAREAYSPDGWHYIAISMEIIEGEYANYFMQHWQNNTNPDKKWGCVLNLGIPTDDGSERDGWTKRKFKTVIEAIEDSNEGYRWDWNEKSLKGKIVGGLFRIEQFIGRDDGKIHETTRVTSACAVEKIRSGNYRLPNDKIIENNPQTAAEQNDGFMTVPDGFEDGLPFN